MSLGSISPIRSHQMKKTVREVWHGSPSQVTGSPPCKPVQLIFCCAENPTRSVPTLIFNYIRFQRLFLLGMISDMSYGITQPSVCSHAPYSNILLVNLMRRNMVIEVHSFCLHSCSCVLCLLTCHTTASTILLVYSMRRNTVMEVWHSFCLHPCSCVLWVQAWFFDRLHSDLILLDDNVSRRCFQNTMTHSDSFS